MILCAAFCDKHVEAIHQRARTIKLDDGATVLFVLKSSPHPQDAPPLTEDQEFIPRRKRVSQEINR